MAPIPDINKVSTRSIEILLVEDNPGDVMLTKRAFLKGKIANNIHVATDGEQALEMLNKQGEYADYVTPDIVLLDLNLPKINGREVLAAMKEHQELRKIPVVILSSSKADTDVIKSYDLQASSYIVKPVDTEKFKEIVEAIENFWFTVVVLPKDIDAIAT